MYRPVLTRLALRMGLLTMLALIAACGGRPEENEPRPLPEEQQELRPGVYGSEEFKPSLSFRVGEGWSNDPPEASDALLLTREETVGLGFVNAQWVFKPTKTGTPNLVEPPEDMVGWFQQHPYLQTSNPEPVTVGGVKGVEFDVVVGDLPKGYNPTCSSIVGQPNCVDLGRLSTGGQIFVAEGEKVRVTVLEEVKGETVIIGFFSPTSEFDEFAPHAQKVVDSVKWGGS